MYFDKFDDNTYIVRLEKGEELLTTLSVFLKQQHIGNATFSGLGSLESPSLAHYDVATKKYTEQHLEGIYELTSLIGNVAWKDKQPIIHPHVTISDQNMKVYGGHLVKSLVSATVEVTITTYPVEL